MTKFLFDLPKSVFQLMIVKDPTQELWTYGRVSSIWNLFFDIETLLEVSDFLFLWLFLFSSFSYCSEILVQLLCLEFFPIF